MSNDNFIVVIPARMHSTRLPQKPLKDIAGLTMIERVYRQAQKSLAAKIVVATDHKDIAQCVLDFGGQVVMTSDQHESGTDRLQEVAEQLALKDSDIVVNVQGDEPLIPPEVINQVAKNLADNPACGVATLSEPIETIEDFLNPNIVKALADQSGRALYFSRAPMPWPRDAFAKDPTALPEDLDAQRHIGIYGYRVKELNHFVQWQQSVLETTECLEQLRFMDNGVAIHIEPACAEVPGGVDTPEDLERLRKLLN